MRRYTWAKFEAPMHEEGAVSVDMSTAAGQFGTFSDVEFQYTARAVIGKVTPRIGVSQGGTVVSVKGRNFASTNMLKCRVGTIITNALWQRSDTIECITPAAQPSPATARKGHLVQVSTNQMDFTPGEAKFIYQELSGVDAAFPGQLPATGGARVAVHLPIAHPTQNPTCRFGMGVVLGILQGAGGYIICVNPAAAPGFLEVHVARNGEDFEYLPRGQAGGLLRTSTRPTLNQSPPPPPRVCVSIQPEDNSCSDLGRVLVLNDPPARWWGPWWR